MANWQVISLDTVTPQLRAPGTGDGYSFNSGSTTLGTWTTTGLTLSTGTLTVSSGTANGVLYLNGSKVATSGSALTFDGTSISFGTVGAKINFPTTSSSTTNYLGGAADGFSLEMVTRRGAIQPISYKQDYSVGHVWGLTSSDAMVLTSTGLGIGTTSPASQLDVSKTGDAVLSLTSSGVQRYQLIARSTSGNFEIYDQTAAAPRVTMTPSGNLGIGTTSPAARLHVAAAAADVVGWFDNSHASTPYGLYVHFSAASPDNNSRYFLRAEDSTAVRCYIWSDGDLANHDGVYGTISDQRLKQDIVDAGSQWEDLKAVRFRKYRMKTDVQANPDSPAMLGVVAQELEAVCPGLVDEHTDTDGETTKTVKSSILFMKAAVALQEAMARIETLEAKVAALESK